MKAPLWVVLCSGLVQPHHVGVRHKFGRPASQVFVRQLNTTAPRLKRFHVVGCPIDVGGFVHTLAQAAIQSKIGAVLLREGHIGALHRAVPVEPKHMTGVWGLDICNFSNGRQQRFYGVVHPHVVGAPTGVGEKQNLLTSLQHEFQRHGNQW